MSAPPATIVGKMSREPRMAGKVAVISGATRGFGQAIAVRFVEEGARVVLLARSSFAETLALINSIEGATPDYVAAHTLCLAADIESEANCAAAAAAAAEKFGPAVHALVNNAALFVFHSVEHASAADWDRSAAVNIKGHALLTKAFLPAMKAAKAEGGASIVWQGSISAFLAQPDCATYVRRASAARVVLHTRVARARARALATALSHDALPDLAPPAPGDDEGRHRSARAQLRVRLLQVRHPLQLRVRGHDRDAHLGRGARRAQLDVRVRFASQARA